MVEHIERQTKQKDAIRAALADCEEFISAQPETFDWPDLDEQSAAAMCYTSGTTGTPTGVAYSHRQPACRR